MSQTNRVQELESAFQLFNQMSSQLEASYQALENRVAQLSEELAAARTERLQQLAEKERLANRLERLLELLPGGVVVADGAGVVTQCNPAAVALLGEPLVGMHWHAIIQRAFVRDSGEGSEIALVNGRQVSISARSLSPEPGQIILLLDVTEQHRLRDLVQHHQRLSAMGEMAASLAHQVRTPLASALLYVSHLKKSDLTDEGRERVVGKVVGRLRHLEHMVNDMLQFARGGSFEMENFPVERLLDELLQTVEPQIQAGAAQLCVDNRAAGQWLRGNREALQSALANLITNALQACGTGAQLQLQVDSNEHDEVQIRLRDDGPGIPEDVREHLFTPFFTTRPGGTGLGLAVVRAIAVAHRGDAWVESQVGQGSTFGLSVPAARAEDALPSQFQTDSRDSVLQLRA